MNPLTRSLADHTATVCFLGLLVKHFGLCRQIIAAFDQIVQLYPTFQHTINGLVYIKENSTNCESTNREKKKKLYHILRCCSCFSQGTTMTISNVTYAKFVLFHPSHSESWQSCLPIWGLGIFANIPQFSQRQWIREPYKSSRHPHGLL